MLRVEQLKVKPLAPMSFALQSGECLAVEGPSGSGKTRLLRAIADLDAVSGFVFHDGIERREIPAPEWRRRVRFASAEPLWWTQTARDAFALTSPAAVERLFGMTSALGLKTASLDQPITTLSTGERQRLALVRSLFDEPRVLLLDEPVSALDKPSAALVGELLKIQLLAGRSIIVTTHDDNAVSRLAGARLQLAKPAGAVGGRNA